MMKKRNKKLSDEHKKNISIALMGNKHGLGKNLGNKNALGKVSGNKNGNWKGGISNKEILAGREKPEYCEICYTKTNLDFDHCHKTGNFRGWICRRCNLVLGMVKDDFILLNNLSKYLLVSNEETRPKYISETFLEIKYNVLLDNNSSKENS